MFTVPLLSKKLIVIIIILDQPDIQSHLFLLFNSVDKKNSKPQKSRNLTHSLNGHVIYSLFLDEDDFWEEAKHFWKI